MASLPKPPLLTKFLDSMGNISTAWRGWFAAVENSSGCQYIRTYPVSSTDVIISDLPLNFDILELKLQSIVPTTSNLSLRVSVSNDSGSTYLSDLRSSTLNTSSNSGYTSSTSTSDIAITDATVVNTTTCGVNGTIELHNNRTSSYPMLIFKTGYRESTGTHLVYTTGLANIHTTSPINTIKLSWSTSDTFVSGKVILYGRKTI